MKSNLFVKTVPVLLSLFLVMCAGDSRGIFEGSGDVGNPKLKGSFSYSASTRTYTLSGAGENIWAEADRFYFVWRKETGNFSLAARIAFEGEGVNAHRKVGVMLRESLEGNARYADVAVHGDGLTSLQYRSETGEQTGEIVAPKGADYVILERVGNLIRMKTATGAYPLEVTGEVELDFPSPCYLGLYICSHEEDVMETAHFTHVEYKQLP
jgi:hypothetical protein